MRKSAHALEPATAAWGGARTPSPEAYRRRDVYEREVERVFRRSWIAVARVDQVARPGDYATIDVFGEPLVVVRDRENEIRVLSRVCRHRAMPVAQGCGNRHSLQCPYHLWTYGLDGRLLGAPGMELADGFDRASVRLPALRSDTWEGWVFATFDPDARPLAHDLGPLARAIAPWRVGELRTLEPLVYESPWNWKVMVENFMESYHHAGIHGDTLQPSFPAERTWAEDADGPFAILHNPVRAAGTPMPALLPSIDGLPEERRGELLVCAAFPLHLFAIASDHMLWYRIEPRAYDHFTLRIFPCVPVAAAEDPALRERIAALRSFVDLVHCQDIRVCEAVQAGLGSRLAAPGHYSHLEKALWQFHRWLAARLAH
jgi:phenylpropionate dioxygenase-like ring-hydroxylating dioxygenase large terminal subunit